MLSQNIVQHGISVKRSLFPDFSGLRTLQGEAPFGAAASRSAAGLPCQRDAGILQEPPNGADPRPARVGDRSPPCRKPQAGPPAPLARRSRPVESRTASSGSKRISRGVAGPRGPDSSVSAVIRPIPAREFDAIETGDRDARRTRGARQRPCNRLEEERSMDGSSGGPCRRPPVVAEKMLVQLCKRLHNC